jgi:hypothetical protein
VKYADGIARKIKKGDNVQQSIVRLLIKTNKKKD